MKRLVTALKITELYDLSHTAAGDYLAGFTYPWQALEGLKDFILALGPKLPKEDSLPRFAKLKKVLVK